MPLITMNMFHQEHHRHLRGIYRNDNRKWTRRGLHKSYNFVAELQSFTYSYTKGLSVVSDLILAVRYYQVTCSSVICIALVKMELA